MATTNTASTADICADCPMAKPDWCRKNGFCAQGAAWPLIGDECPCPACRSDMAGLAPCMREKDDG